MTWRYVLVVLALTWCPVAAAAISSIVLLSAAAAQGRRALSPAAGLIGDLLSTAAPWRQQPLSPELQWRQDMYSFLRCHGAALGHREICFPHSLRQLQPNPLQPQLEAKKEVEAKEEYIKTKHIYCLSTCNGTQWLLHHSIRVFRSRSKDKTKEIVVENQAIITISSHLIKEFQNLTYSKKTLNPW